jgi:hypothetical protein
MKERLEHIEAIIEQTAQSNEAIAIFPKPEKDK